VNFIKELNDIINNDKEKFGYDQESIMLSTGFECFDYLNALVTSDDKGKKHIKKGLGCGRIATIIGKSGVGKSTFAIQTAYNLIKPYKEGSMFILDFEQSNSEERVRMVTGMSQEYFQDHVNIKKIGISTESVLNLAVQIMKLKKEHEKELLVDNAEGICDAEGNIVKILPTTVIMIDSVAMMMPKAQLDEQEMQGQMSATAMAKANTQLFKRLVQICMTGNIVCLFVNHITQKITTGPMPVAASINYLKMDESLPGGNAPQFLTDTLIKLTASTKLEEDKLYQIKGFNIKVELIKSRSAPAGRSIDMIYNQREGFDNELSILEYIKANGKLKGAGVSYKLEGLEDHVFRLSNFKEKLKEDIVLKDYFFSLGRSLLENSVKESSKFEKISEEEIVIEEEGENINEKKE